MEKELNFLTSFDVIKSMSITTNEEGDWVFEGIASTSSIDLFGDVVRPASFFKTIEFFKEKGQIYYNHGYAKQDASLDEKTPIGRALDAKVLDNGLWIKGVLNKQHPLAQKIWREFLANPDPHFSKSMGLSIGAKAMGNIERKYSQAHGKYVNYLPELILYEVSLTPTPVNPDTYSWATTIKSLVVDHEDSTDIVTMQIAPDEVVYDHKNQKIVIKSSVKNEDNTVYVFEQEIDLSEDILKAMEDNKDKNKKPDGEKPSDTESANKPPQGGDSAPAGDAGTPPAGDSGAPAGDPAGAPTDDAAGQEPGGEGGDGLDALLGGGEGGAPAGDPAAGGDPLAGDPLAGDPGAAGGDPFGGPAGGAGGAPGGAPADPMAAGGAPADPNANPMGEGQTLDDSIGGMGAAQDNSTALILDKLDTLLDVLSEYIQVQQSNNATGANPQQDGGIPGSTVPPQNPIDNDTMKALLVEVVRAELPGIMKSVFETMNVQNSVVQKSVDSARPVVVNQPAVVLAAPVVAVNETNEGSVMKSIEAQVAEKVAPESMTILKSFVAEFNAIKGHAQAVSIKRSEVIKKAVEATNITVKDFVDLANEELKNNKGRK